MNVNQDSQHCNITQILEAHCFVGPSKEWGRMETRTQIHCDPSSNAYCKITALSRQLVDEQPDAWPMYG